MMYVRALPTTDVNRNTEWFTYPGVWTTYILILFFSWLLVLSIFNCSPGMAWTIVHLAHFAVSKRKIDLIRFNSIREPLFFFIGYVSFVSLDEGNAVWG